MSVLPQTNCLSDPGHHQPCGREEVHGSGLPQRLREDKSGHALPHAARLEGRVRGRRHRLDEV